MRRLVLVLTLAAVVVSALTAAATLLQVDGGTLQVFEYAASDIELLPPIDGCDDNCGDIQVLPPIDDCDDNCGEIESTAEDDENPAKHLPAKYEIRPGDTLTDIAARFGTSVAEIVRLNQLQDPNLIFYGSTLNLPDVGGEAGGATVGVSP